jgi:hypothetical protein
MRRRSQPPRGDALYAAALRKHLLAERLNPAEARELRRRRLAGGAYPTPQRTDATRRLAFAHLDPRQA